jgi:starch phosphorylase
MTDRATSSEPARPRGAPDRWPDFQRTWEDAHCPSSVADVEEALARNLKIRLGIRPADATPRDLFLSLAYTVRDITVDRLHASDLAYATASRKRVAYLSMEFLIGRLLLTNLVNLNLAHVAEAALAPLGVTLLELAEHEPDAGLGNGGLGRLAACFLESLSTHGYPAIGYGICYQHGMFRQEIRDGRQVERLDNWLKSPSPWMITRSELSVPVHFFGRVENGNGHDGSFLPRWVDTEPVLGVPRDVPIVGYGGRFANRLRLWSAASTAELDLDLFNQGDYVGAARKKIKSESISKILYPNDHVEKGRELRLMQEYFFVACSIADALRDYLGVDHDLRGLPGRLALQMNDTHPALAVVELMRVLVDGHRFEWEAAWDVVVRTVGYTNHTLLPEALEKWPTTLLAHVLPRHLQIIREIDRRFLEVIRVTMPDVPGAAARAAPIVPGEDETVRMAHLAVIGSHATNGVSALHSNLIRSDLFPDLARLWPERFSNKTNGVTQRVWMLKANPRLSALVTQRIGPEWVTSLEALARLRGAEDDPELLARIAAVKAANKADAAAWIRRTTGIPVDPAMLFDVQVKRLHEYKRQLMNALGTLVRYRRLKAGAGGSMVPRAVLFGGKAAPGYAMAKLILRFICRVADLVNGDPAAAGRLCVAFLPDYNVTLAERLIPAADLSQQISTAGCEASGTGNMKFAMNGALTLGTLDGANIEMRDAIGPDFFFGFGLSAPEIAALRPTHAPKQVLEAHPEIAECVAMLADGSLSPEEPALFNPLYQTLVEGKDRFFVLADLPAWLAAQDRVDRLYADRLSWGRACVVNVAAMGPFSSDRTIREYAAGIWGLPSVFEDAP